MKRTSKFCAILFCAMLWLNPVGAQQKTMPIAENNSMELKMDKVPLMMQRQKSKSDLKKMQAVGSDARLMQLSEDQKAEMVKSYMRAAFTPKAVAKAPKAGADAPKTFIGGAYMSYDILAMGFTAHFTIDENGNPSLVKDMESPIYNNAQGLLGFPLNGTWNGQYFEGNWAAMYSTSGEIAGFFGYYIYDPASNQVQKLCETAQTGLNAYNSYIAYDYSTKKNFAIRRYEHQTEDGNWVCDSNLVFQAAPNTGIYTRVAKLSGVEESIVTMTITKEGAMYAIALDGSLYSINTTTWDATEVGNTGIELLDMGLSQAMAADYRSGKLYWNYFDVEEEMGIAEVNATTGEANPVGSFENYLTCMASIYYPNNQPKEITDFALGYENAKVKASFTVPALTVNGEAISQLDTVEIFKVVGNSVVGRVWAQQNPTPGQKISLELENLGSNGETVTLAIRVKDKNGKYSSYVTASVLLFNVTLPYVNGFETDAVNPMAAIVVTDPQNKGGMERTTDEHHTGNYSFKMSGLYAAGDARQVTISGMPVKKGGVYAVNLWAKTTAKADDGILFAFDGAEFKQYFSVGSDWEQWGNTYEATATGQMSLTLQGYGAVAQDINATYFIDDIEVRELVSPDVPAPFVFNSVTAASNGALQAVANITLPDKTMAEESLSKIDSIVFQVAASYLFLGTITQTTVKEGLTPGATTNVMVDVPKAGNYYIRAIIYNEKGGCPYYSQYLNAAGTNYQQTPWIGSDLPASVKVTATPGTDGTVALSWLAPTATHQGYIGAVTYKLTDAAGTVLYNGSNLAFTTAPLALGMHTFTLEFSDDVANKSFNFNTLAGIQQGMVYSNVATIGTTETRVLNVSATAENSAFSQMLYPATNQAMYIDTLLLFATAPTTGEAMQYTKIYMGTTDLTAFGGNAIAPAKDFVEKDKLTEVFADTLRFKAGENTLKLPLKGFYYNGKQSLVISVVKPMQEATTFAAAAYVAVSENNMLKYRAVSTSIDFDTVKSYNDYTGTPNGYAVSMVAAPGADLKTMKVTVDSADITLLENAIITIVNKGGKNMNATITTGADGIAIFDYMPQGTYVVKAQKAGYIASEQEINVATISPVEVSFHLIKAKEVKVSGTVQDKGGNNLAGVMVKAAGLADFTATTDNAGAFELQNVYAPGEYTLSFEKAGMRTLSVPFVLGEKDTMLEKVELGYHIVDVPMASVAVEDGKAVVKWTTPSVSSTVTWASTFTQIRRLAIDNETPFKYAQRFLPEDLAELNLGNTPKALRFSFMVGSETAQYSIVLAADTTHEIYRAEVPAAKLKENEWCHIDIPAESAAIDVTKELWLIVEVSGENQGYPCATTTTGTVNNKGNLMYYKNKWYQIQELFTNSSVPGNVLIRLLVEDASTQAVPANGYRVYRGLLKDEFKDYTLLTTNTVSATTYTDAAYAALPFGQYNYAVVSDWYGDDLSEPAYTNTLNKDMEFTVAFKVTSNAGSAKDAVVYMVDTAMTRDYEAIVNDKDTATIAKKVWRDVYDYEITLPYHQTVTGKLDLVSDTVITIALQEIVLNPELTANIEGKDVVVNYGVNLHNWFDDVESYEDFAIENIGDYILSEPTDKGGIKDVMWTNAGEPQSWIVFNPSNTRPAMSLPAHSGNKMFAAFYNAYPQGVEPEANSDYLIRPVSKGGGVFIFYCRAYSNQMPEAFEVVYSSTTADLSAFKTIQAYNNVTVTSWTPVVVNIPEDAKFVGIHCTSIDAFIFVVDDLAYYTEDPANPTAYELYLDGTKVKDAKVDELTYTFQNLEFGEHKVGVKAIYASGSSELVEKTVNVSAEAMPINLNVAVDERTAVLTWNMPEGFTPKSYKVFLDGEQKAENLTEKTYTFSELKNGTYTAAVVAVYETGESEKATVEFIINSHVDVEDFDMAVRSSVYPNPNDGMFYLKAADKGTVEVYAMNGQLVKRVEIPAQGTYSINLQNRAKGLYLMKFATRENTTLFKIVVR